MRLTVVTLLVATSAARAGTPAAERNARDVLDAQISTLRQDDAKRRVPYADGAVLFGSGSSEPVKDIAQDYVQLLPTMGSVQIDSITIDSVTAGGGDAFVWYTSTLAFKSSGAAEGAGMFTSKGKARVTQLAASDGKAWKVVASLAAYLDNGNPDRREPDPPGGATKPGPLTPLLASPKAIAAALATDPHVFVIGTAKTERAIGPKAAKTLLASWSKLQLAVDGDVREVETATYGFAQARVKWTKGKDTYWMAAMILAVPAADGSWKVVGVHYANIVL